MLAEPFLNFHVLQWCCRGLVGAPHFLRRRLLLVVLKRDYSDSITILFCHDVALSVFLICGWTCEIIIILNFLLPWLLNRLHGRSLEASFIEDAEVV